MDNIIYYILGSDLSFSPTAFLRAALFLCLFEAITSLISSFFRGVR